MKQAIFNYPKEFVSLADYTAHANQIVEVVRELTIDEADVSLEHIESGNEMMYLVRAADGWEGHAFESELEIIK